MVLVTIRCRSMSYRRGTGMSSKVLTRALAALIPLVLAGTIAPIASAAPPVDDPFYRYRNVR